MREAIFVADAFSIWGAERSLLDICAQGPQHGWHPVVCCPVESPLHSFASERGIDTREVDWVDHPRRGSGMPGAGPRDIAAEGKAVLAAARVLARTTRGADALIGYEMWRALETVIAGRRRGILTVLDIHDTFTGRIGGSMGTLAANLATGVIAPSAYTLRRWRAPRRASSAVVPRAVPVSLIPLRSSDRAQVITLGLIGELRIYKRVELAIELVEWLNRRQPARLLLVGGDSGHPEALRKVAEAVARIPEQVEVVPKVNDIRTELSRCDFVVSTAEGEAFGRTIVEGLAEGVPPAVLDGAGPAEIVATTGVGLVASTVESLATEIAALALDRPRYDAMSDGGRRAAGKHYSLDAVGAAYWGHLSQLLAIR